MIGGGVTFGMVRGLISSVVDNGVCEDDERIISRVNEATMALLPELIAVGGLATYDVVAVGTTLLLPKELENAIAVEVLNDGKVRNQTDVRQGWYDLVNPLVYLDPAMAHDNPLVDLGLVPETGDPSILRRKYDYPGLSSGATVRVTGAKRYIAITQDSDYLIIQNVRALKLMILSIEKEENDVSELAERHRTNAIELLKAEAKKHQLDPRNSMQRKANYEADMATLGPDTMGYIRARLAFELPNGLLMGKSELTRLLEQAEMRLMDKGAPVGTLDEFSATVRSGRILVPANVKSILAADLCGQSLNVRSIFFQYVNDGPGRSDCGSMLIDEGERTLQDGQRRRQYRLTSGTNEDGSCLTFVAKLRWMKKAPDELLTVRNYEALRLMCQAILNERAEKWKESVAAQTMAVDVIEKELREYLSGIVHTIPHQTGCLGVADLGGVL